jgi:DNA-binding beta-propeller fold protein YncE
MCKQAEKIWYTAMDDTTPYSGEVEIDNSKKSKKAYGIGHCWKCQNGNGIFWKKTWNGAFPDTCWSCNGTGKGKVRLYTLKQVQGQIKRAEKNHILYLNKLALGNEINALKNIAYNYSEKGVAQRAKRLAWKKDKIVTKNNSEFVGQVKDRGTFDLTLTFRKGFETDFGVSFLNTLKDAQGNVFTYWGNSLNDVEENSTITVKATIKDHREYDGTKQTVINRPKIIEEII